MQYRRRRPSTALWLVALSPALGAAGCISGSLATSTGPNGPQAWSAASQQDAHVGEEVRFSFILVNPMLDRPMDPYGYADYCLTSVGDHRICADADPGGRFRFAHRLDDVKPGQTVEVTTTAYRQYGERDFMKVSGQWMRGDSNLDETDRKVVSESLTLQIYETEISLELPAGDASFDFETGKLELISRAGQVVSVYVDRPNRRGFFVEGPDERGAFRIRYVPQGGEVGVSGETEARFCVFDSAGQSHCITEMIPTP